MKQLRDKIGFLLVQICRAHRQQAEQRLNELGLHTGQEMLLLRLAEEDGLTQTRLAELMRLEPPTVTKMLTRMGRLIERRQDAEDARISRIYLTPQGCALQQGIVETWEHLDELTLKGLTETEQLLLRRLLMQVYQNLSS